MQVRPYFCKEVRLGECGHSVCSCNLCFGQKLGTRKCIQNVSGEVKEAVLIFFMSLVLEAVSGARQLWCEQE